MPEFQDITSLALLAVVLVMGERWLNKLLDHLIAHDERQLAILAECSENFLAIKESLSALRPKE